MKTFYILLIFIFALNTASSQKHFNNWYFGDSAGVTFNTPDGEPEALFDGAMITTASPSVISDSLGNLLFYTNGQTVYNRFHQVMVNGNGLKGTSYFLQTTIIVPKPGFDYIYYIFTVDGSSYSSQSNGFFYSIVDMSKEKGMGAVTKKNVLLMDNNFQAIAAVGHSNGRDIWITIYNSEEKCFVSYLLTENGISTNPIKSPVNINLNYNIYRLGIMKISPNGKKIAFMTHNDPEKFWNRNFYLFDLNDKSGEITNGIKLSIFDEPSYYGGWGSWGSSLEFSLNSNYLYISACYDTTEDGSHYYEHCLLEQYDISISDSEKINNSKVIIFEEYDTDINIGGLQIAPNNKIYISRFDTILSVINKPDLKGPACDFELDGPAVGRLTGFGLPAKVMNYIPHKLLWHGDSIEICEKDILVLPAPVYKVAQYEWKGPKGFTSTEKNPVFNDPKSDMSGDYYYTVKYNGKTVYQNQFHVIINPISEIVFSNISEITVFGDSYNLRSVDNPFSLKINWIGINSNENTVKITKSGKYTVTVENERKCKNKASVNIDMKLPLCEGDDFSFIPKEYKNAEYHWQGPLGFVSDEKILVRKNLKASMSGEYYLKIIIRNDSTGAVEKVINNIVVLMVNPREKILFSNKKDIYTCIDSLELSAVSNPDECTFEWQGIVSDKNKVTIKQSGKYGVRVRNKSGCIDSATVNIHLNDNIKIQILSDKTGICGDGTVNLSVNDNYKDYLWSTGETTSTIAVNKGGKYILKAKSEGGCEGIDSITIEEFESPKVEFEKSQYTICKGENFTLKPIETKSEYEYIWSDGVTETERTFDASAELYLIAKSPNGCADTAFVKVDILDMPVAKILADKTEVCFGERITLAAGNYNPQFEYLWSNGEKGESINVSESGTYRLIARNTNLCTDTAEINIAVHPDLALELTADNTNLCFSDSAKISAKQKYAEYLWSTGETTETITVNDAGIYSLIAKNEFGCADTAGIEINKFNSKLVFVQNEFNFDELCVGESNIEDLRMNIESDLPVKITGIYFKTDNFTIENKNSFIREYQNGEIADLKIIFKPVEAAEIYDTLFIETGEPCYSIFTIPVNGSSKTKFRFALPDIMTESGKRLEIPIKVALLCMNSGKLLSDYEIEITVDGEYFIPDGVKIGQIIENKIESNHRIMKIKANAEFEKLSGEMQTINIIYGKALMGRSETVPLTIENVDFANERYFPEYLNGSLQVNGCVNDLSGLIMFKKTEMLISPNPTDGDLKVTVGTQEEGIFAIKIFDVQGREIAKREFTKSNRNYEESDYSFNISSLGTGAYSVQLTAPWTFLQKKLVIVK